MGEPPLEEVLDQIQLMYTPRAAGSQDAINWLLEYMDTDGPWDVFPVLLRQPDLSDHDPAVQYYCANGLHTKVLRDWGKQSVERREEIHGMLWDVLEAVCMSTHITVIRRLCLALSLVAVYSDGGPSHLCTSAADLVSDGSSGAIQATTGEEAAPHMQRVLVGMELLKNLPEEMGKADASAAVLRRARTQLEELSPMLLQLLASVATADASPLTVENANESNSSFVACTFECLSAWVAAGVGVTLEMLAARAPGLLEAVLVASTMTSVTDVLKAGCNVAHALISARSPGDDLITDPESDRGMALAQVCAALIAVTPAWRDAAKEDSTDEEILWPLSRLIAAVGEYETGWIVDALAMESGDAAVVAVGVVELLLDMARVSHRNIATLPFNFFLQLCDYEPDERPEALSVPAFSSLLESLVAQVAYPERFDPAIGWGGSVGGFLDNEAFVAYRDGFSGVGDVLDACLDVLGADFVRYLSDVLEEGSWQAHEAVFFCLSRTGKDLCAVMEDKLIDERAIADMHDRLEVFLRQVADTDPSDCVEPLVQSTASWLGKMAPWIGHMSNSTPDAAIGALRYALSALLLPSASRSAAVAVRDIVRKAERVVATTEIVTTISHSLDVAALAGLDTPERKIVLSAISRAITVLPLEETTHMAEMVSAPMIARITAAVDATKRAGPDSSVGFDNGTTVQREVSLLEAMVSFLEFESETLGARAHPAVPMLEVLWPLLETAMEMWEGSTDVASAICAFFKQSLLSLGIVMEEALPELLERHTILYERQQCPAALDVLMAATEKYGKRDDIPVKEVLRDILFRIGKVTLPLSESEQLLIEYADVVEKFFNLCHTFVLFCPESLVRSDALEFTLELATAALSCPRRQTVAATCKYVDTLFNRTVARGPTMRPLVESIGEAVSARGRELLVRIVFVLSQDGDAAMLNPLAAALYSFVRLMPDEVGEWLGETLDEVVYRAVESLKESGSAAASPDDLNTGAASLSEEDRALLMRMMHTLVHTELRSVPRFKALVRDFAGLCRFQQTKDALISYQDVLM